MRIAGCSRGPGAHAGSFPSLRERVLSSHSASGLLLPPAGHASRQNAKKALSGSLRLRGAVTEPVRYRLDRWVRAVRGNDYSLPLVRRARDARRENQWAPQWFETVAIRRKGTIGRSADCAAGRQGQDEDPERD